MSILISSTIKTHILLRSFHKGLPCKILSESNERFWTWFIQQTFAKHTHTPWIMTFSSVEYICACGLLILVVKE